MKIVKVNQLVKRYKEVLALDHFSMEAKKGEIFGLLGPNGSGKTTAIFSMLGLLKYDKGEIEIFGERTDVLSKDVRMKIGLVPQELAIFEDLTVLENVEYFCGLYIKDSKQRKQYVEEALEFTGLKEHKKFLAKKLSGGLKRRLNIACGISHKPELIFFDEPTVAVDAQSRNFILEGIKDMKDRGATIIYTTHYLEEAQMICDQILIMDKGRNIVQGTLQELIGMINTREKVSFHLPFVPEDFEEKLHQLEDVLSVQRNENEFLVSFKEGTRNIATILHLLEKEGVVYDKLFSEKPSLNDVFLSFTGKELRE